MNLTIGNNHGKIHLIPVRIKKNTKDPQILTGSGFSRLGSREHTSPGSPTRTCTMRKFNSIRTNFWRKLPSDLKCDARYVLIYLITNDLVGPTGLQPLADGRICSDLGISPDTLHEALMGLREHNLIIMQDGYIWTPLRWKNEMTRKGKIESLVTDEIDCMPDEIKEAFSTLSDTLLNTLSDTHDGDSLEDTDTDTDREKKRKDIKRKKSLLDDPGKFKTTGKEKL